MRKPNERVEMSSWIPYWVVRKLKRTAERRLPRPVWDGLCQFWVQTRLIFSRTILLVAGALLLAFTWGTIIMTIEGKTLRAIEVCGMLTSQAAILAIAMHMGLWETERDSRAFELLLMRIPNLHRLIWTKLRVSLTWAVMLILPFWLGFSWFATLTLSESLMVLACCLMAIVAAAMLTCVVSSFVQNSLAAGIMFLITIQHLQRAAGFIPALSPQTSSIARGQAPRLADVS